MERVPEIGVLPHAIAIAADRHDVTVMDQPIKEEAEEYCRPIVGNELISVERLDYSWFVTFGGGATVATEALWRLLAEGRIVVTSEDHGHQFGLPEPVDAAAVLLARARDGRTTGATIALATGDLTIDFGDGMQLQFLQTSSG
jgi:hypothetical protein